MDTIDTSDASTRQPVAAADLPAFGGDPPPRRIVSLARPLIPVAAALFVTACWAFAAEYIVFGCVRLLYPLPIAEATVTKVNLRRSSTNEWQSATYCYKVDSNEYGGETLWRSTTDGGGFVEGDRLTVEYHPLKPHRSVIWPVSAQREFGVGITLAVLPLLAVLWPGLLGRAMKAVSRYGIGVERNGSKIHLFCQPVDARVRSRRLVMLSVLTLGTMVLPWVFLCALQVAKGLSLGMVMGLSAVPLVLMAGLIVIRVTVGRWFTRRKQRKERSQPLPQMTSLSLDIESRMLTLRPAPGNQCRPIVDVTKSPLLPDDHFIILDIQDAATVWPYATAGRSRTLALVRPSQKRVYSITPANTDSAVLAAETLNSALGSQSIQKLVVTLRTWPQLVWPTTMPAISGRGRGTYATCMVMFAMFVCMLAYGFKIGAVVRDLPDLVRGSLGFMDACRVLSKTAIVATPACVALACLVGLLQHLWLRHRWPDVERPEKEVVFPPD